MENKTTEKKGWDSIEAAQRDYAYPCGADGISEPSDGRCLGNLLLSQNMALCMDTRLTRINNNVLLIGSAGTGKTRHYIKPNLLQANSSYLVVDPSGEISESVRDYLEEKGYAVKVFKPDDPAASVHYNPLAYVETDSDMAVIADVIISAAHNHNPAAPSADIFFIQAEKQILISVISYVVKREPKENRNMSRVAELIRDMYVDERSPRPISKTDVMFQAYEKECPDDPAMTAYKTARTLLTGRTLKAVIISLMVAVKPFTEDQVNLITEDDTIDLESVGKKKQAIFIAIPTMTTTYDFLVPMMIYQVVNLMYKNQPSPEIPGMASFRNGLCMHLILDEFGRIGRIPNFPIMLATMRKHGMSCSIIVQSKSQIKAIYEDDTDTIIANCSTLLYFGSPNAADAEYVSGRLQKYGPHVKSMYPDALLRASNDTCYIIMERAGVFTDKKYRLEDHRNYNKLRDM